jgi:GNAT superfamily N-acetyltransferase
MADYETSFDPARIDVEAAHAYLSRSYWAAGIPIAVLRRAIANSLCIAAFAEGAQVGFARVVTDRATFAYLADVYVLEAHRGRGLARRLVSELLAHPELQGLRRLMLVTRDAHAVYAPFGFRPLAHPERVMELHRPGVYETTSKEQP